MIYVFKKIPFVSDILFDTVGFSVKLIGDSVVKNLIYPVVFNKITVAASVYFIGGAVAGGGFCFVGDRLLLRITSCYGGGYIFCRPKHRAAQPGKDAVCDSDVFACAKTYTVTARELEGNVVNDTAMCRTVNDIIGFANLYRLESVGGISFCGIEV